MGSAARAPLFGIKSAASSRRRRRRQQHRCSRRRRRSNRVSGNFSLFFFPPLPAAAAAACSSSSRRRPDAGLLGAPGLLCMGLVLPPPGSRARPPPPALPAPVPCSLAASRSPAPCAKLSLSLFFLLLLPLPPNPGRPLLRGPRAAAGDPREGGGARGEARAGTLEAPPGRAGPAGVRGPGGGGARPRVPAARQRRRLAGVGVPVQRAPPPIAPHPDRCRGPGRSARPARSCPAGRAPAFLAGPLREPRSSVVVRGSGGGEAAEPSSTLALSARPGEQRQERAKGLRSGH